MEAVARVQPAETPYAVKIRSLERLIRPLIDQMTTFADEDSFQNLKRSTKSGSVLVAAVEQGLSDFIDTAKKAINFCETDDRLMKDLLDAVKDVEDSGIEMVQSGREFVKKTSGSQRRTRCTIAARILLSKIARVLIIADMVDIHVILEKIAKLNDGLSRIMSARSKDELTTFFNTVHPVLDELSVITHLRLNDLVDSTAKEDLCAARAWLKMTSTILYTSFAACLEHPKADRARLNRDFAHIELIKSLQLMSDSIEGRPSESDVGYSHHGKIGELVRELDQFQSRVYMEPNMYKGRTHRGELENHLERIITGAAAIADSDSTREERKKRIVDECNNLRQALQELLEEYEKNYGRSEPTEDLDLAMVHIGHKIKDLRRHLRRAAVDHVSDAFLDIKTPYMMLSESAQKLDENGVTEHSGVFLDHASKLVEVAHLVCKMSNNEEYIKAVKYSAGMLEKLAPQVKLLTVAIDTMITVDDFLAVSEAHIIDDVKAAILAVLDGDGYTLDRAAGGIRGRSLRVCSVVDSEMDLVAPSPYVDRVRIATKLLREELVSQFAHRAERIVNKLEVPPNQDENRNADIDEIIEASELVHNAVKEIRNALLMNRNPEDVDSDNEYEDDHHSGTLSNKGQYHDAENQQKIMLQLPEEEKRKIQEQIDVFKITQNKFEREVAKWDETGNDIIALAKNMCMIMMNMTDFTRGRGPLRTTMDVIKAAQEISDAGAKLNFLAKQIGNESVESETKKDLFAYLQRITLYCQQLNITSKVKADVQQVGNELVVSCLESAMSLIQTARNLLNAVVLTVKSAYIASTKYRRKNTLTPSLVEWKMAPPQKQPLVRPQTHSIIRRASDRRPLPPIKALAEFRIG